MSPPRRRQRRRHRSSAGVPWEIFWRHFRQDRFALAGLVIIFLMLLMAIFAPVIANITTHQPNEVNLNSLDEYGLPSAPRWWPDTYDPTTGEKISEAPPGYLLGVDDTGRDQFVRIAYGARTSLQVAFIATGIALVIGVLLGLSAGFYRGKVDTVISRATDVVLALPDPAPRARDRVRVRRQRGGMLLGLRSNPGSGP